MFYERRLSLRRAVNIPCEVVWGDGLARAVASIRDLSSSGLRLRLDQDITIGSEGYVLFEHRLEPFRVVWQASRSAGLQFTLAA